MVRTKPPVLENQDTERPVKRGFLGRAWDWFFGPSPEERMKRRVDDIIAREINHVDFWAGSVTTEPLPHKPLIVERPTKDHNGTPLRPNPTIRLSARTRPRLERVLRDADALVLDINDPRLYDAFMAFQETLVASFEEALPIAQRLRENASPLAPSELRRRLKRAEERLQALEEQKRGGKDVDVEIAATIARKKTYERRLKETKQ